MKSVLSQYRACRLCPRLCSADRTAGRRGICGESAELRVAAVLAHFGEEPPISGERGSGTVFFSGCSLRCCFCQNIQISQEHLGKTISAEHLVESLQQLAETSGVHNINFVTPDHFAAHLPLIVAQLRTKKIDIPMVYNTSGYSLVPVLQELEPFIDIYLPDFKYSDSDLANKLSHAPDYPDKALNAVAEMVRQKGFLDSFTSGHVVAGQGTLVRHLVLPGFISNSIDALSMLYTEFGRDLPISLMSQFHPVGKTEIESLQRRLYRQEFQQSVQHAQELGFQHLFVQDTELDEEGDDAPFVPDFRRKSPFRGNQGEDQLK
ncbi:MAG TPA: radical SAM protein [bacterium]|nr:radical SAM protein [bacterium]HPG45349.1 radical SAM protein [bacterium]HPM96875.1 radical SAM protein [bacterium]